MDVNIPGKIKAQSSLLMQIVFVLLAFALMIVTSYFFLRNIENEHLSEKVSYTFSDIEALLDSGLQEYETMHGTVAETLRGMLLLGMSREVAEGYIRDINRYGHEVAQLPGLMNAYAMFEMFGGAMFNPLYEDPSTEFHGDPDFDPTTRDWYKTAVAAEGRPAVTDIYRDFTSGRYTFTYTQALFDDAGDLIAIACLDVALDLLYEFTLENRNNEQGFWTLHDKNHVIIAHPNSEFVGKTMHEIDSTIAAFADVLEQEGSITNALAYDDFSGRPISLSIHQVENGWYLGVVIFTDDYYSNLTQILQFLIILGMLLAAGLITILIRINTAKGKSEELTMALALEKEAAEQSSNYKSAFLANMSHEIRTPMNAILGIAEIRMQDDKLSSETEDALKKIYDSGSLLLSIVNDILDLSKIEAGKLEITPVRYDIPSLINDVIQINLMRYESTPVEFHLELDENVPLNVYGDELRIKQILSNILSNAFKYTDEGEINMSVSFEKPPGSEDDVTIIFRVRDTGQGMTEEQLGKIFAEYTRFNLEANRTTVGTGLGLHITKRLVDLMNGEIFVESRVGEGSVFTVHIPQKQTDCIVCGTDMADRLKEFRFQSTSMLKRSRLKREPMPYGRVLVVDDVESNLYVARGMLLPYGLQIDTASSGFEAIDKIKNGNVYDIVFMDHMMPRMDGIEAMNNMRKLGYTKCIVALTANALVGHAEAFIDKGFDDYLSKPIDSRELDRMLGKYIRKKNKSKAGGTPAKSRPGAKGEKSPAAAAAPDDKEMAKVRELFMLDAQSAVEALESINLAPGEITDDDYEMYEITVHGMKSAFNNIGETGLSDFALKLEKAAKAKDLDAMAKETPAFIEAMRELLCL